MNYTNYADTCLKRYGTNPADWNDWLELEAIECHNRKVKKELGDTLIEYCDRLDNLFFNSAQE